MPLTIPVAILGFSAFDRKALASYFGLAQSPSPRYRSVLGVDDAQLVIADANEPGVVTLLQTLGRTGDAVFIGDQAPADAAAWLMPPIDPVHVLRQLDALQAQRNNPRSAPLPLTLPASLNWAQTRDPQRAVKLAPGATAPSRRADDEAVPPPSRANARELNEQRRQKRAAARRPQVAPRALLVDDSEIALHFMRRQLEAYGMEVDLARHSDRALDLLTHHVYGMVFLDLDLGEQSRVNGLTLCHQIRHQLLHPGGRAPMVVMVSASHDPVDQVRGTLAGAEAYLGKPLDLDALDRLLQAQGLQRRVPDAPAPPQPPSPEPG